MENLNKFIIERKSSIGPSIRKFLILQKFISQKKV